VVTLPAGYVAESTELGYATTVHAAQGITADTMHGLIGGDGTRQHLYTNPRPRRHAQVRHHSAARTGQPCGQARRRHRPLSRRPPRRRRTHRQPSAKSGDRPLRGTRRRRAHRRTGLADPARPPAATRRGRRRPGHRADQRGRNTRAGHRGRPRSRPRHPPRRNRQPWDRAAALAARHTAPPPRSPDVGPIPPGALATHHRPGHSGARRRRQSSSRVGGRA
jgi:hypothetical protein